MDHTRPTAWDRVGAAAVVLLLVAFLFMVMRPPLSTAGADDRIAAKPMTTSTR